MTETDDDPVASWNERVGTLRKRGRISGAALAVVPAEDVDVRRGRPVAPERLSEAERELWERLTVSRRPGWFSGAEALLESYVVTALQAQQLEAALRKAKPGTSDRYVKLARTHRQAVALAATLATRLRLTPHSKLDKNQPRPTLGEEIIAWIEAECRVPEGALVGRAIRKIYDNPAGTRRCIISVGRKSGKTTFAACLLLVHLVGRASVPNSQPIALSRFCS